MDCIGYPEMPPWSNSLKPVVKSTAKLDKEKDDSIVHEIEGLHKQYNHDGTYIGCDENT